VAPLRVLVALLLAAGAAHGKEKLRAGDLAHARELFRIHCAGCHGEGVPTPIGKSLGAPRLNEPAFIASRSDEQLIAAILKGGPGPHSPAFGRWLTLLDAADLVALLRGPLPGVEDVFPEASAYTAKTYKLTGNLLMRAENLAGDLSPEERELTVFSVYRGPKSPLGPRLVPQDPVQLDDLFPKAKLGYLVFGPLPGPKGEPGVVALALSKEFKVLRIVGGPGTRELHKLSAVVLGKGARDPGLRRPFVYKPAPERARALTRLYARAVEAAAVAEKEEVDRHLFDPPEVTSKGRAQGP